MTNEGKQTNDAGSDGIPQREGPAIVGSSREVSQTDKAVPVTGAAGPANDEPERAKKHATGHQTGGRKVKGVFRKTELLGIAPPAEPEENRKARQRTLKNIRDPDGEIAYRPFEDSFRTFVCSLVERQERIYDEMLLHAADLQQQIDALGRQRAEQQKSPGNAEVKG
jgi:hypothetical protein